TSRGKALRWPENRPSDTGPVMRAQPDGAFEPPGTSDAILPPRSRLELLMARAAGRLDRFVLERFIRRHMLTSPRDGDELRQRLVRAREFYADHDFIAHPDRFFAPPTSLRTQLQHRHALRDGELLEVTYESDFVSVFPEERSDPRPNRAGVARWWRHRRPGHPAMLCVHGYGGGHLWLERLAFDAGRFYRAGLDVVLYVLPYHGLPSPHPALRAPLLRHRPGADQRGLRPGDLRAARAATLPAHDRDGTRGGLRHEPRGVRDGAARHRRVRARICRADDSAHLARRDDVGRGRRQPPARPGDRARLDAGAPARRPPGARAARAGAARPARAPPHHRGAGRPHLSPCPRRRPLAALGTPAHPLVPGRTPG